MLLHKDGMIELNYDVAQDILTVRWPNMAEFSFSEIKYSFQKLIDTLKHYDIKKLLIDSRKNVVEISDTEYTARLQKFSIELFTTRLTKVARIQAFDPAREKRVNEITDEVKKQADTPIAFRNFVDEASALVWLKES